MHLLSFRKRFLTSLLANEYSVDSFSLNLCDLAVTFFSLISLRLSFNDRVSALIQFLPLFLFFPSTHSHAWSSSSLLSSMLILHPFLSLHQRYLAPRNYSFTDIWVSQSRGVVPLPAIFCLGGISSQLY